ncbi:MAG: hypothetical protein IPM28_09500 [Chloracidobacterium sp.]|nr:hypothetical protein [Chloracidobacterium sp.]
MPRKRVLKESDRKELETLLLNPHFGAVYRGLRKKSEYADVEALKFLRLYIAQIEFVESHSDEPLVVRDHLNELRLDDFHRKLVADGLARWFVKPAGSGIVFTNPGVSEFYFNVFGDYPDLNDEVRPRTIDANGASDGLKRGIESTGSAGSKRTTRDFDPAKRGLTIDRAIMLLYAIGGSRLKGLVYKDVAIALSYLTGFKEGEFVKRFSHVLPNEEKGIKKFNNQTDAYNKDVKVVTRILSEMGLGNEAEKLRSDSGV